MKFTAIATLIFAISTALGTGAVAQTRHDSPGSQHGVMRASGAGLITGIDAPGKKITLEHETIGKFKMEASTHEFDLKSAKTLGTFKQGDKVAFDLEKTGPDMKVVRLRKRM